MSCIACTDRTDQKREGDTYPMSARVPPGSGPFRHDASGSGLNMSMPPRDWHVAVKEFVRQQLYGEVEPLRVQVALLQNQIRSLDQQLALGDSHASPEKKLMESDWISPRLESWMTEQDNKFYETSARLEKAEGVLKELGMLHDKFLTRHDALVQCVQDIDERVDKAIAGKQLGPDTSKFATGHPGEPHNALAPDAFGFGAPTNSVLPTPHVDDPAPQNGSHQVWMAGEHQAALEVEQFSFQVERKPGTSLGMILRNDGKKLVIDKIVEGCPLPVKVGDRIVGIDGIRAESERLLEMIRRNGTLQITCHRLLTTTL